MTTARNDVIAVNEDSKACGLIAMWTLSGVVNIDQLASLCTSIGIKNDLLPTAPSELVALKRALKDLYPKDEIVPLPKTRGYVVGETRFRTVEDSEKPDAYIFNRLKVWLDSGDVLKVTVAEDGSNMTAADQSAIKRAIWAEYQRKQMEVDASDLSTWLVKVVDDLDAVRLRDSGGIYFVPQHAVNGYRALANAVESCGKSRLFEIPAMRSDKAVETVLAALTEELDSEVVRMDRQLSEGELGARALRSRRESIKDMMSKVGRYEKLLGTKLTAITEAVEAMNARIVEAILATDA